MFLVEFLLSVHSNRNIISINFDEFVNAIAFV